mgnify:CR=1 FL=1
MTRDAKKILKEALKLPADARASIVDELQASLSAEADPEVDAAWAAEIQRRIEALQAGTVKSIPWSEVRRKLWRRLRAASQR